MILKQVAPVPHIKKTAPQITTPFKGIELNQPHRFYRRTALSEAVAGYCDGPRNPYVETLMRMQLPSQGSVIFGVNGLYQGIDLTEYIDDPKLEQRHGWYLGAIQWKIAQILIQHDQEGVKTMSAHPLTFLVIHAIMTSSPGSVRAS